MLLSKQQIADLYNGLRNAEHLPSAKFSYAVARNISRLTPLVKEIMSATTPSKEFVEYETQRRALIGDGKTEPKAALDKLDAQHKEAIDARKKQVEEFEKSLAQEWEVDLYMIPSSYLPEEITAKQTTDILLIIQE
jgi:hypothetical protein